MSGPNVGYATLSIIPSMKGALGKLKSEVGDPLDAAGDEAGSTSSKKFGDSFKSGLKTAAKVGAAAFAVGFGAAAAFGKDAIGAASDLDESMSKVNVVFGKSSDTIVDWSKTAATSLGASQQQALEAVGTYGNLFQAFGIGRDASAGMSTSLVQLATDLASFNNTSVPEALQALQSGVSGETEPLKRYGVAINDVRLKEEALALGLIQTSKDALSPAAKAQAAYALIMKDTTLAQGDFARTSDGLANKQRIMAARFNDVKAKIGAALLPAMSAAVGFITDKVIPGFQAMASWVIDHWPQIKAVAVAVFNGVRSAIAPVIETVIPLLLKGFKAAFGWLMDNKEVLIGVAAAIGVGLVALFVSWAAGAATAAAATLAAAAPFIAIGAVIAGVVAGVIYAYNHFEVFRNVVDAVGRFLRDVLWPALKTIASFLIDVVSTAISVVATTASWLWENVLAPLAEFLGAAFKVAWDVAGAAIDVVKGAIDILVDAGMWLWHNVLEPFVSFLGGALKVALDAAKVYFDIWKTAITYVVDAALWLWHNVLEPFVTFLATGFQAGLDTAKRVFQTAWDGIKAAADLAWTLIKAAIVTPIQAAFDAVGLIWSAITSAASTAWDGLKSAASTAWDAIKDVIWKPIESAAHTIENWWDAIVSTVTGLPKRIADAAVGMWDGIKEAFRTAINWIIRGWNAIEFRVPSIDIPLVGTFGGFTIGLPDIPTLATGGVARRSTLAMIGEYPGAVSNPEIVSPKSLLEDTFRNVLLESPYALNPLPSTTVARTVDRPTGPLIGEVHNHTDVDVDGFWRQANFLLAGQLAGR